MNFFKPVIILTTFSLMGFISQSTAQFNKKKTVQETVSKVPGYLHDTLIAPIPLQREMFTDRVYEAINNIDLRDGVKDNFVKFKDAASSEKVTQALITDGKKLIILVENMDISHAEKLNFHRVLHQFFSRMNNEAWNTKTASFFVQNVENIRQLILGNMENKIFDVVKASPTLTTFDNLQYFNDDKSKAYLYEKLAYEYPEKMIKKLMDVANEPYADHIVAAAAKNDPGTILEYAKSNSILSGVIRRNSDPLVKTIVKVADESKHTLDALPFLGAIHRKEITIAEVDAFRTNENNYFMALVDLIKADEKLGRSAIDMELKTRALKYVRKINELHDASDVVRFASITNKGFRAEDFYIMTWGGQDEIYTSSFTRGTFPLMMAALKPNSSMQLLDTLNKFQFRSFIRITAGFNRLNEFINTMKVEERKSLFEAFVNNLEDGKMDDLEDAVDVADAYGSIKDTVISKFLKDEIVRHYERVYKLNNASSRKGVLVYGLLASILKSYENPEKMDADIDQIPPITYIPNNQLVLDTNGIVQQVFFYGDEDGKTAYAGWLPFYKNSKEYKVEENKHWVTITGKGKEKMTIYANKPLTEPQDEEAQEALAKYMEENQIIPTVIVHRGHSYFVPTTLEYLNPDVKVVVLGSCGGYHNLAGVLDRAPDAHIISSKQTGTRVANEVITRTLNNQLLSGNGINWLNMWTTLDGEFKKLSSFDREIYSDYVPPNRNLGSIFIKVYRKMAEEYL